MEGSFHTTLTAARLGAEWAWAAIYRELAPRVLRYLRSRGAADPEDLLGAVFLDAVQGLPRFKGGHAEFRAWVFTIAHDRFVDDVRRRPRQPGNSAPPETFAETAASDHAGHHATASLEFEGARGALEQLPPDQRDVLLLRVVMGLNIGDTARALGKTQGAVKSLQAKGLATLARDLSSRAVSFQALSAAQRVVMSRTRDIDARAFDRILAGKAPTGDDGLQVIADFVHDLNATFPEDPVPNAVAAVHIAAIVAAAQVVAESGDVAVRLVRGGSSIRRGGGRKKRRVVAKLAAASAAFLMLFCGLAVAGTLPVAVQSFASRAASAVGVTIPRPDTQTTTPRAAVANPAAGASHPAEAAPTAKRRSIVKPTRMQGGDQTKSQGDPHSQRQSGKRQSSQGQGQDAGHQHGQGQGARDPHRQGQGAGDQLGQGKGGGGK